MQSMLALAIGFAVAGLLSSGYQMLTMQPASFRLLQEGERSQALAALPFLLFAAPFIIVRSTIRISQLGRGGFGFGMISTLLAGFWSLMSGTLVVMTLSSVGRLVA